MAKVLAVLASLLFISITVLCVPAIDRNDPSLEIIKNEDAEEGYDDYRFKESLVCQNPRSPDNTVKTLSGNPPHMSSNIQVTCDKGKHFIGSEKSTVNVTCLPLPHPCMCMAAWETLDDYMLMYDFNCTAERVQNEINPDVKYDDKTELPPPVEEVELELPSEQQGNENSINPDTETDEYLPEEDLDGTFFEDNVEEERNDVSVNINDMEQTEEIEPENEQHTVTDNEVPEYIEQTENENTEENEEENEVEEEIEENDTWEDEENVDNEEEEEHHEESFEVETFLEEEEEELQETGMEPTDAETDGFDPWYEENLSEEEEEEEEEEDEEDFTNIRGQSLILTAMAELTKYDDDDSLGNTDIVEDDYQELVEPPEELNVVQTSPAEATDDTGNMQENSICSLPAESGKCKAYFPRYFYNSNSGECELFIYGGCDGNKNNFDTLHACESTCVRHDGL